MNGPTLQQLQLQRQQLRKQLVQMHSIISDLCQQSSQRKLSDVLNLRTQANGKELLALRTQHQQYCAILDGKYPNAIREELEKMKQEKITIKREIGELQRVINTQVVEYSGEDRYLKEEFALKAETENVRQKNTVRAEQIAKQVRQLNQIKHQIHVLNARNLELSGSVADESTVPQAELTQKLNQLKEKKAKVLEQIQRKKNLRVSEYNRKIAKLDQLDLVTGDFEETLEYMESKLEQTTQQLQKLQIKQKQAKKRCASFVLPTLQKLQTTTINGQPSAKYPLYGSRAKQASLIPPVKMKTSPLQEQYPEQYKDLFFEVPKKAMKSATTKKRNMGDRIRMGFQ